MDRASDVRAEARLARQAKLIEDFVVQSTEEHATLADLAKRLDLDKHVAQRASVAAFEVSVLPEGGKPEKYDFAKLSEKLKERLPNL